MTNAAKQARDALLIVIAVAALVVAGTVGHALASDPPPATDSADAGFARDMRDHHLQAITMSDIVRDRTTDPTVRFLAYDISSGQGLQAGMFMGWLQDWGLDQTDQSRKQMAWMSDGEGHGHGGGHDMAGMDAGTMLLPDGRMPGMATKADIEKLRTLQGREAEVFWLRLMIAHHRGGVDMAKYALRVVEHPYERVVAQGIVDSQTSEIDYMNELLVQRGSGPA